MPQQTDLHCYFVISDDRNGSPVLANEGRQNIASLKKKNIFPGLHCSGKSCQRFESCHTRIILAGPALRAFHEKDLANCTQKNLVVKRH